MITLHITLTEDNPIFQKARARSKTGAMGHIGTHFDCYTLAPSASHYELPGIVLDCREGLPEIDACRNLPNLTGKALLLHTANEETNGYGNDAYFKRETSFTDEALKEILENHHPAFIVIDSHGIGPSGAIHTARDVLCEKHNCHVIENTNLGALAGKAQVTLIIDVDIANPSTGKPCKVYAKDTA